MCSCCCFSLVFADLVYTVYVHLEKLHCIDPYLVCVCAFFQFFVVTTLSHSLLLLILRLLLCIVDHDIQIDSCIATFYFASFSSLSHWIFKTTSLIVVNRTQRFLCICGRARSHEYNLKQEASQQVSKKQDDVSIKIFTFMLFSTLVYDFIDYHFSWIDLKWSE